jgi:general secretion pathway protein C
MLNGARLIEIYADHVTFERLGQKAELYLEGSQPSHKVASDLLLVGGPALQARGSQPANAESPDRTLALTDYIRPNPVFEGDRLKGVELFPGARADAFVRLGLSPGDVMTAVNGVPVTDMATVMNVLEQLFVGGGVDATLTRGGQVVQASLSGSALSVEALRGAGTSEIGE